MKHGMKANNSARYSQCVNKQSMPSTFRKRCLLKLSCPEIHQLTALTSDNTEHSKEKTVKFLLININ